MQKPERGLGGLARKSEKRQRNSVLTVRMTDAEMELAKRLAAKAGLPLSTFLRDRALTPVATPVAARSTTPSLGAFNSGPPTNAVVIIVRSGFQRGSAINA